MKPADNKATQSNANKGRKVGQFLTAVDNFPPFSISMLFYLYEYRLA